MQALSEMDLIACPCFRILTVDRLSARVANVLSTELHAVIPPGRTLRRGTSDIKVMQRRNDLESLSFLHHINLLPSSLEWLMDA